MSLEERIAEKQHQLREILRDMLRNEPEPGRRNVYIIELFSGHGSVSDIGRTFLGDCPVVSVDIDDTYGEPTIRATLPRDSALVIQQCRALYPDARPIVWASPPCTDYSIAKTSGTRDLEAADRNVAVIPEIATALNAVAVLIENPATGLLVGRKVISFMPFKFEVHYCKYGRLYQKPTMIWCSHDLRAFGFQPRVCKYDCDACYRCNGTGNMRHARSVASYGIGMRISVPDGLVACVFRAVSEQVRALLPPASDTVLPRAARADDVGAVNLILGSRAAEDGSAEVLVEWVGHDHTDWIAAANLDADMELYDYVDEDVRAMCVALQ